VTVWVHGGGSEVRVYSGQARLEGGGASQLVQSGQRATLGPDGRPGQAEDRQVQLLGPGGQDLFAAHDDGWQRLDKQNGPPDLPGQRLWAPVQLDGQELTALRIVRRSVAETHGETGLSKTLNLDVFGYRHLILRAWVRVDGASLSGGGQQGTEYPMILRAHYEGPVAPSDWIFVNGFYAANPENQPHLDALLWPQGQWQLYTVDLMQTEASRVPYRLRDIEVLGQGHSYDAQVAGLQLIGD
jgi:hypothetical protein